MKVLALIAIALFCKSQHVYPRPLLLEGFFREIGQMEWVLNFFIGNLIFHLSLEMLENEPKSCLAVA